MPKIVERKNGPLFWCVQHTHKFGTDTHIIEHPVEPPRELVVEWAREIFEFDPDDGDELDVDSHPINIIVD